MTDAKLLTFYERINIDGFVKSPKTPFPVIPAKAGIQSFQALLDSRLRGSDDFCGFLRLRQYWRRTEWPKDDT
jgi:hypothetical protein